MGNDTIDKFLGDNGLIPINVPSLDSPSYVSDWNDAFQNVKTNLATLANRDFVKGETGDSSVMQVEPLVVDLTGDGTLYITEYGWRMMNVICPNGVRYTGHSEFPFALNMCIFNEEGIYAPVTGKIKKTIYDEHGTHDIEEVVTYHWYSQFIEKNDEGEPTAGNVYVISEKNGLATEDETIPYSSLYYTFLDRRFYNSCGESISEEIYETLEDLSCVLNLVPDDSTVFTYEKYDAFPTMYYEENSGMCWKINGAKTGMPIRGIPGADGKNAVLHIMKAERTPNESECRIKEIFDNGFKTLSDIDTIKSLNGQSAIVFVPSDENEEKNNFYFSKMYLNDSSEIESDWHLISYCDETNALNTQIAYNDFINVLKAINLYKSDTENITTLKGLFIPIETAVVESENAEGEETESTVLTTQAVHLMTAVTNKDNASEDEEKPNLLFTPIANINSTDSDDYQLYIDTYLYLEYDSKLIFGTSEDQNESSEYKKLGKGWGQPSTHVLKYSLVEYINNSETVQTLELKEDFPDEIKSAIETTGIYHWTLVESKNTNYDVDELINAFDSDSGYSFNNELDNIYTLTSTPGVDTDFYWYCPYPNFENDEEQPSWTKKKFIFKKLVPIVSGKTKSYSYAKDTTLNLNYNVNILGDDNLEGSHNLTIHGNLSSNSANIYGSLSAKDYKDINTSTVIRGEEGIELGKILIDEDTNEYKPAFVIDGGGNITESSSINTNTVITGNVAASGNITGADISCQNFKLARNSNIGISADIISTSNTDLGDDTILNNSSNIYINNAHHLKISKNENLKGITKENINNTIKSSDLIPHINSKVPLFVNDNANIIVTNSSDIEDVYVEYSNTGTMPLNFRKYTNENGINSLDFNAAKDYNLYKTTNSKKSSIINQSPVDGVNPSNVNAPYYDVNPMRSSWISDQTSWTLPVNKDRAIAKFKIVREKDNDVLANNIKFNLSEYVLYLGIYGRCHYSRWPQLKSGSNIELSYYLGDDNEPDIQSGLLFTDTTTYNFKDIDCAYTGINHNSGEYGGKERYYYFKFAPYSKTIYSSSTIFTKINEKFTTNTSKYVTIWVIPKITLNVKSENFRNTYKQIIFKGFKYYNTTNPNSSSEITKTTLTNWPSGSYSFVKPTCEYSISRVIGDTEHKATTICDNGIVFTSGNYLFGIGYGENIYNHSSATQSNRYAKENGNIWGTKSNPTTYIEDNNDICLDGKPMLFYVDTSKNGVSEWINSVNGYVKGYSKKIVNFNYNRAINAIPLEDIFNVIRYVRSQHNDWDKFGL